LRQLEVSLNAAFDMYREMYYEGGISSVYLWDLEEGGAGKEVAFAGAVLLKKSECGLAAVIATWCLAHRPRSCKDDHHAWRGLLNARLIA